MTKTIPEELRKLDQWCLWRWEERDGKPTKPPYQTNGHGAKSNDKKTWAPFKTVLKASQNGNKWAGIGFMLTPPYVGVDLDKCRDPETGGIRDWGRSIVDTFKSYTEVSPSGTGVKILLKGDLPGGGHHSERIGVFQKNRYFCITGDAVNGHSEIRECQTELDALIKREWPGDLKQAAAMPTLKEPTTLTKADLAIYEKASDAKNGEKFLQLWNGEWDAYPSHSEADAALCSMLAFWTRDPAQIDRLFRGSKLYRDKWERKDYRERTIAGVLKDRPETYVKRAGGAPSMADLREYIDLQVDGGVNFTADEICRAMAAYKREHRVTIYKYLSRLVVDKIIKKDPYRHGGYKKIQSICAYEMGGFIEHRSFEIDLPLDLHKMIKMEPNHLTSIAGSTDAGKSSLLYHIMKLNYREWPIVHFSSPEWGVDAIKARMDDIGIERPHPNVTCYPMEPGYEDLIPPEPCIVLVDYLRTNEAFNELDRQYHAILANLRGGVAFTAIQKHIGQDKPTGGQYAVHAAHHVILLDPWEDLFVCKIFKTKNERRLRGYYRVFNYKNRLLEPVSRAWKMGEIHWGKAKI